MNIQEKIAEKAKEYSREVNGDYKTQIDFKYACNWLPAGLLEYFKANYALIAPNGEVQFGPMETTRKECIGLIDLFSRWGICKPYKELIAEGFYIQKVAVTISKHQ